MKENKRKALMKRLFSEVARALAHHTPWITRVFYIGLLDCASESPEGQCLLGSQTPVDSYSLQYQTNEQALLPAQAE